MSENQRAEEPDDVDPFVEQSLASQAEREDETPETDQPEPETTEEEPKAEEPQADLEEQPEAPEAEQPQDDGEPTDDPNTVAGLKRALAATRQKNRDLEAEAQKRTIEDAARKAVADHQKQDPPSTKRPDRELDPEGYEAAWQRDLANSRVKAIDEHGAAKVAEIEATFDAYFHAGRIPQETVSKIQATSDQLSVVKDWYDGIQAARSQRETMDVLAEYNGSLDAYYEARKAQEAQQQPPVVGAQPQTVPAQMVPAGKKTAPHLTKVGGGGRGAGQSLDGTADVDPFVQASLASAKVFPD